MEVKKKKNFVAMLSLSRVCVFGQEKKREERMCVMWVRMK